MDAVVVKLNEIDRFLIKPLCNKMYDIVYMNYGRANVTEDEFMKVCDDVGKLANAIVKDQYKFINKPIELQVEPKEWYNMYSSYLLLEL